MLKRGKFKTDLMFNYMSLVLLAVSGVLINVMIVHQYDTAVLGQFNLVYAYYILISQFSVLGVHYSVLRALALRQHQSLTSVRKIITSGLVLVTLVSFISSLIVYGLVRILWQTQVAVFVIEGFKGIGFALPFFALNKVMLAALNGKRRMRSFSLFQACRYLLMLGYVVCLAYTHVDAVFLCYVFFVSEAALFVLLMGPMFASVLRYKMIFCHTWFLSHVKFGGNAFFSGVLLEVNSRIDIIILAYFVSPAKVGIYSFAAMIAEGFAMVLLLLKNHVNPIMANLLHQKKQQALRNFMSKIMKYTYLLMFAGVSLCLFLYFILTRYFMTDPTLQASWPVLLIILMSMLFVAGYLPFTDFLIQANLPRLQSIQNLLVVLSNLVLSWVLIPSLGIFGAAIAVGLSTYIISVLLIDRFARKQGLFFIKLGQLDLKPAFE